jgi:hypothetical protein
VNAEYKLVLRRFSGGKGVDANIVKSFEVKEFFSGRGEAARK